MMFVLGNGDFRSGVDILQELAKRLDHARNKHKWGKGKEIDSATKAYNALQGENQEWLRAINEETPERQFDEVLDVLAVAIRMANKEFEN